MALKDTWVDKVDDVDIIRAEDINQVARAVIELESKKNESVNIVQEIGDSETNVMSQKATTENILQGYDFKSITDTIVFLSERDPRNVKIYLDSGNVTIHGVNQFDLEKTIFTPSSYTSSHIISKEGNGIKVDCNINYEGATTFVKTTFNVSLSGLLYFSCEADCDGDLRDLMFLVKVNGEKHAMCYGKGLLYQAVNVAKGDTIELCFYTHMGTTAGNTVYYKNIQCAYDGLYEYTPHSEPITNIISKTLVLPNDDMMNNWLASTTAPATGGLYRYVLNTEIDDMVEYPTNNDAVPSNVIVNGADLVTYNETYQGVEGVGISTTGKVSLFLESVQSHTALLNYLESNPITITYETTEKYANLDVSNIRQGNIIEFKTPQEVTYYYKPNVEKKYTCVCFGDSITGMFADKTDYPSMMEHNTDLTCFNVGFSGSQLTDHSNANYRPFSLNRLADAVVSKDFTSQDATAKTCGGLYPEHLSTLKSIDFSKVDFVTVFFGTNDWSNNATLKSEDDKSEESKQHTNVEDALKYSIQTLLTAYPHLRFLVLTPYWRSVSSGKDSDIDANNKGVYLIDFSDYIEKIAEENLHVPTINLYRRSGANAITNRYYTSDGTHPTEMLKRIIAKQILSQFRLFE